MNSQRKIPMRLLVIIGAAALVVSLVVQPARAEYKPDTPPPEPYIISGVVTVVFAEDAELSDYNDGFKRANFALPTLDAVLDQFEVSSARSLFPWEERRPDKASGMPDYTRYWELRFPETHDVAEVIAALEQNPNVRLAEPVWALPLAATPNDPSFSSQWHWNNAGLNMEGGWDYETGSDSIVVAIIDSGVNHDHADLRRHLWINPGEDIDGDMVPFDTDDLNGIDDDGNGVIDDLNGYDFFTGISNPHPGEDAGTPDPDYNDFNGHGTGCAGIVSAITNNSNYVAGMAGGWTEADRYYRGVSIMALRVGATASDGNGYVNSNNCGTAIQYAARNGAHVINCSWGSTYTSTMNAGMALVDSAGVTITHAAGNDDANDPDYLDGDPANVQVLSVSSVTGSDVKSSFSNYGFWVDVSAYGDAILMPYSNQYSPTTTTSWGTSFAAPMVAGLAALIRSAMPSLTKEQVDSIIINTADDINGVNPSYFGMLGSGRISASAALGGLANAKFVADVYEGPAPLTVQFTDQSPYLPTAWTWSFGTGDSAGVQNPQYTYNDPGIYDVSLIVDDSVTLGPGEEHLRNLIWVTADTLKMDSVIIERGGTAVVGVRVSNTSLLKELQFAFDFTNDDGIALDSFTVAGTRTDYFYDVSLNGLSGQKQSIRFRPDDPASGSSNYLPADTGAILNLWFSAASYAPPAAVVVIDTTHIGTKTTRLTSIWGELIPVIVPGKVVVNACGRGDVDCSGAIDIQDLVLLVAFMFQGGPPPDPWYTGDVNGDGSGPSIDDLVYLVSYMFSSGPPPPPL